MKPGDLVMTKRAGDGEELAAALILDNGDMIGITERTPALVLDVHDEMRNRNGEPLLKVLIKGLVGTLWPNELEELDEAG
jgi:hypothetical protein